MHNQYNILVNATTVSRLLDLNRQFYQTFALQFSATRQRLQPGVLRVLEALDPTARVLDLGCGNGELARELAQREHRGAYVGLDFSTELLAEAKKRIPENLEVIFLPVDLSAYDWDAAISVAKFDAILAFAVLHHLPGTKLHQQVLKKVHANLSKDGYLIHSEWQFLNSPRLRARIQSWEHVGLTTADVDPGDHLLDWRHGGYGLRYVHHFSEAELETLAMKTGFTIVETFLSDGEGGILGLYQTWRKS